MSYLLSILLFSIPSLAAPKMAEVWADKSFYSAGSKAVLSALLYSKPDNASMEFDVTSSLNGVELPMQKVTDYQYYVQTGALGSGFYNWSVRVYVQDARLARDLKVAAQTYADRIAAIDQQLVTETNPTVIAALLAEKADKAALRTACLNQLGAIRSQIFSTYLNLSVN